MKRSQELRALADRLETMEDLETDARAAKAAYQEDPTPQTKAAHRAASQALNDARQTVRSFGVLTTSGEPGSATVVPASVNGA